MEFLELVDKKRWLAIQNYFAEVIGTGVRVIDTHGAPLTNLSNPHHYCLDIVAASPEAFEKCRDCLLLSPQPYSRDTLLSRKEQFLDKPSNIHYDLCPFFINRVIIPIKEDDSTVCANIVIGPVILGKRRTYSEYFTIARDLGK